MDSDMTWTMDTDLFTVTGKTVPSACPSVRGSGVSVHNKAKWDISSLRFSLANSSSPYHPTPGFCFGYCLWLMFLLSILWQNNCLKALFGNRIKWGEKPHRSGRQRHIEERRHLGRPERKCPLCRGSASQNMIASKDSEAHILQSPMLMDCIVFFSAQVPAYFDRVVVPPAVSAWWLCIPYFIKSGDS